VAVVQISKIQVRRGQKNSNSGVPQLSSAEFAWALDTQELFIGNGSVADGAPYVGNTKILTEHDNLLALASSYQFASDDTSISLSVPRTLQGKLDEYVSVTDFGAVGDGSTDCVAAFTTAFNELFKNVNENYRKVLMVPNGEYLFTSGLAIPSGVILKGETQEGAVLNIGSNSIRFVTSTGLESAVFESTNRPQNIKISNLTIKRVTGQLVLTGVANSTFDTVKFLGEYNLGNTVSSYATEPAAVFWNNDQAGIKVDNINFNSCRFEANSISVKCVQTVRFDTKVKFTNCEFFENDTGIYISGVPFDSTKTPPFQGNRWQIKDCDFEEVAKQAFKSTNGFGTQITQSKFKLCGNSTGNAASPLESIVYFGEKTDNVVIDCTSDRFQAAALTTPTRPLPSSTASVIEVYNGDKVSFIDRNFAPIERSNSFVPLAVFSAFNKYIVVDYLLTLGEFSRSGQLHLTVGDGLSQVAITDNFQYSTPFTSSFGGTLMTNFEFAAELRDNDDTTGDSSLSIDTVVLSYKNPLLVSGSAGAGGSISFDVTYGV
jgi:hypothetical protein